jgi:hypothetical protein
MLMQFGYARTTDRIGHRPLSGWGDYRQLR